MTDAEHDDETPVPAEVGAFVGLADLDEDLRTLAQSSAELERWRRLSLRGVASSGGERERATSPGEVLAPSLASPLRASGVRAREGTRPGEVGGPRATPSPSGGAAPGAAAERTVERDLRALGLASVTTTRKVPSVPPGPMGGTGVARRSFSAPKGASRPPRLEAREGSSPPSAATPPLAPPDAPASPRDPPPRAHRLAALRGLLDVSLELEPWMIAIALAALVALVLALGYLLLL